MKLSRATWFLVVLAPLAAHAAGSASLLNIDLNGGTVARWVGITLGIAKSWLFFLFALGMAMEAMKSPTSPREFGRVIWRALMVFFLLKAYPTLFSFVMSETQKLATQIAPANVWDSLKQATTDFVVAKMTTKDVKAVDPAVLQLDGMGGVVMDALVSLCILIGQAMFRILSTFGLVLAMVLYVLGPLSIVLSVPTGSDLGSKWFRVFASVLSWPIISALLAGLLVEFGIQGLTPGNSYEAAFNAIILSGLMCVCTFAVPTIASALMGSSMGALGAGFASMQQWAGATVGKAAAGAAALAGAGGAAGAAQIAKTVGKAAAESVSAGAGGGGGGGFSDIGGAEGRGGGPRGGPGGGSGGGAAHAAIGSAAPMIEPRIAFGRASSAPVPGSVQPHEKAPEMGGAAAEFERPAAMGIGAIAPSGVPEGNRMELAKAHDAPTHRGPDAGLHRGEGSTVPARAGNLSDAMPTPRVSPDAAAALMAASSNGPAGRPAGARPLPVVPAVAPVGNPLAQRIFDKAHYPHEEYQQRRGELIEAYGRHGGKVEGLAQELGRPAVAVQERLARFNVGPKDLQPPPFSDPQEKPTQRLPAAPSFTPPKKG